MQLEFELSFYDGVVQHFYNYATGSHWKSVDCGIPPSLSLFQDPLGPEVVEPVRIPSMYQIHLFKKYMYSIGVYTKKLLRNHDTKQCKYERTKNVIR